MLANYYNYNNVVANFTDIHVQFATLCYFSRVRNLAKISNSLKFAKISTRILR